MKYVIILLIATQPHFAQEAWANHSRIYPEQLQGIPTGLALYHTPSPNYPVPTNDPDGPKYKWEHDTCIIPLLENLQIIEAGSFIWLKDKGWVPNMKFSRREAEKAFGILDKKLQKENYCFEKNTRYGNQLFAGDALWYVLATDKSGTIYKGVGIIETEAEIKNFMKATIIKAKP